MQWQWKLVFIMMLFGYFCCLTSFAQPIQLPSLFGAGDAQDQYQKNTVLQHGENPEAKIHKLIFIKTSISKKEAYVGEPILVIYQLYTAVSCHSSVTKQVAFSGCSVIEMTSDEPEQTLKEKGVLYRVQLMRKVQLIPLQPGDLIIPPATVNNEVSFSTTDNPYLQKQYVSDVSSEPYNIRINALPEPAPNNFSGITGKFAIAAKTDSASIATGENNRLQVTITGAGNIEAITEPKINWPKHSDHFDPTDSQHINRLNFPESGDKTFIFPFIVTKKGRTSIPVISFTYFDTELKKFETVSTQEIPLLVTAAAKKTNPLALVTQDISNGVYLWFVPGIAALVIVVWLLSNRNEKKVVKQSPPVINEEVKHSNAEEPKTVKPDYELLLTALNETEDNRTFFTNAKTLLMSALQHQLSPKQDDEMILLNLLNNKEESLAKEAQQIIAVCNQNLYSPEEDKATRKKIIEQLSELINQLETV